MSGERLREAAARIREHADAATPGRWWAYTDEPWYGDGQKVLALDRDCAALAPGEWPDGMQERVDDVDATCGPLFNGDVRLAADGHHVALWDPTTARAVAALLDVLSWFPSQADPTDLAAAHALADEILRG